MPIKAEFIFTRNRKADKPVIYIKEFHEHDLPPDSDPLTIEMRLLSLPFVLLAEKRGWSIESYKWWNCATAEHTH